MNREELIALVEDIIACKGSDSEINEMLNVFASKVPHPAAPDLIYYPQAEMTPEEIVDSASAYRPIILD